MIRTLLIWLAALGLALGAEPASLRVVAANLTSSPEQAWSPDNANHSNPEGAGARILKALKPDIALIQEFNTTIPVRQWINRTFDARYQFVREEGKQIPNGIISRFPIAASGVWDDPVLDNREFVWARLRLPDGSDLWAVSVHLHTKSEGSRARQATALVRHVKTQVPRDARIVIGGDLNVRRTDEACLAVLGQVVAIPARLPVDDLGVPHTNAPRNRPYDWVLASRPLDETRVPVRIGGLVFADGLVFDTRVFRALHRCPPAQRGDSGVPFMQHMAVVRDFRLP